VPLGASFPIHDWQFWVATLVFLAAAWWLLKGILPIPFLKRRREAKRRTKRVHITISAKKSQPSDP
jgi:uncharacterized membrane protein YwzB